MRFLMLICGDESAAEHANDGCGGWDTEMVRRGVLTGGGGLRPPDEAASVRVRDGQVLRTDGPFAETKDQVGGYCFLECSGMAEALEVAAQHPAATYGRIEVREILELPPEDGH